MKRTLLKLTDVHTHIGAYHILHGVDLEVPEGQVTMLLGRNGAGKTTTLRTLMSRLIQDKVKRPLADELLFGKLVNGGRVRLDVADGELALDVQAEPEKLLPAVVE